jgi:2-keto-4-pentenoate hydratase/2-oxohepta-3-ene-1,7-dioic acid hydratase in catechol pathway
MRIIRYQSNQATVDYGWVLDDPAGLLVGPIEGSPFGDFRRLEATLPLDQVKLFPPVEPSKIICIARNYAAHAKEHDSPVPDVPMLFLKPPTTLIGSGETILLPPQSQQIEHEAELTVVVGQRGRWIPPEQALDHVFGYTIANDVTARDLQRRDGQWGRAKGFDTFCPLGPWIETVFDPSDSLITCNVNGEMRQMASTRDMVFSIRQLIAFVSSVMTLEVGDILLTGTPAGVGILSPGDQIEIIIEGIGTLTNPVQAEAPR